jgi:hypothetical protein
MSVLKRADAGRSPFLAEVSDEIHLKPNMVIPVFLYPNWITLSGGR